MNALDTTDNVLGRWQAERILIVTVRLALALALLMPLVSLGGWRPDSIFPHVVGKALYFRLLVEIALAAWLLLILRFPSYRPVRSWLLTALAAYLGIALIASLAGVSPVRSLWSDYERMSGWIGLAHFAAFAVMAASVLRRFRHWEAMLNVNLLVAFALGLIGLLAVASGRGERLGLTFGNPSFMAGYALVNVFIATAFLARSFLSGGRGDHRSDLYLSMLRSLWVAVILLDLLLLSQSGTRGAAAGLFAGSFCFFILGAIWGGGRAVRTVCAVAVLLATLLVVLVFAVRTTPLFAPIVNISPTVSRLADVDIRTSAVQSRLGAIRHGLEGFAERPVLGWGPENFYAAYDANVDYAAAAGLYRFDRAHNRIVEELVTTGVVGLALFCALWTALGWTLLSRMRALTLSDRAFIAFVAAGLVGYFVHTLVLFDTPGTLVQIFLLTGFALYLGEGPVSDSLESAAARESTEAGRQAASKKSARHLSSGPAFASNVAVMSIALLAVAYVLVVRPYLGATGTHAALSGSRTAEDRLARYGTAVSSAPWLSNETVRRFAAALTDNWEDLPEPERARVLETIGRDIDAGIRREPTDWRLHLAAAELYNRASLDDPSLTAVSRSHTERVAAIAPGRVETLQLRAQQYIVEDKRDDARALIDDYLARSEVYLSRDSATYRSLERMRGVAMAPQ